MSDSFLENEFGDSDQTPIDRPNLSLEAQHVSDLFEKHCRTARLTPGLLFAAFQRYEQGAKRDVLIQNTRHFFLRRAVLIPNGLETLPSPWLSLLPQVLLGTLKPHWDHIPYMITSLRLWNCVLCVSFAQESEPHADNRVTRWDQLRMTLNTALLPNLWTPLSREDRTRIWFSYPQLREHLLGFFPRVQPRLN